MIDCEAHPLSVPLVLRTRLPRPLGEVISPDWLQAGLSISAPAPLAADDELRAKVRDLLRHGGYKPTGRGKPASEYLLRSATEGRLGSINACVDVCNVVSLHSGLPISVVDADLCSPPLRIAIARGAPPYVFNAAGQTIDVEGLLCLFDAAGPCANAVKDSQRTKTHAGTRTTLSVLWSLRGEEARGEAASAWYRELLTRLGADVQAIAGA